jgi:hypothetical protein
VKGVDMLRILGTILLLAAHPALAQQGLRDSDIRLSKAELTDYLSGYVLEFYNDNLATYRPDGSYLFNYTPQDDALPGTYKVSEDSSVCTNFSNGFSRCDFIVQSGQRHVMIIKNGDRYPIRSRRLE